MDEIPHPEHPNPYAERKNWLSLNGAWDLSVLAGGKSTRFTHPIIVPFSPETLRSGIENFVLASGETLRYQKTVTLTKNLLLGKTILHFGAVDSECRVFWNGKDVGGHVGGFTAFSVDVTKHAFLGENVVEVFVTDEATRNGGTRGKQNDKRGGIWYTPQSGIWQSVWIESTPIVCIEDLCIQTNAFDPSVTISAKGIQRGKIQIYDDETLLLDLPFDGHKKIRHDFTLWSPENPKLYSLVLLSEHGDELRSVFGVRSFGIGQDKNGKKRFLLNGKPYFFNGLLDQGYWSDGMLTYPSDQAASGELQTLKNMGFNTIRKHIKLEPMRWYYHCDTMGLIVMQDFVNGGGTYKFTHIAAFPFLGFHHRDDDYAYFAREDEKQRNQFIIEAKETVKQLQNVTSIGVWVPFNEGWGQFDSEKITQFVLSLDDTRIIDAVSGWHDQGKNATPIKSLHTYYTPLRVPKDSRPVLLSEFGGYSMKVSGHVYDENTAFGYKKFDTQEKLLCAIRKLYLEKLLPLISKGLCGAIYTQVSDVEEEINGIFTYDRAVQKIPTDFMKEINDKLMEEAEKIQ